MNEKDMNNAIAKLAEATDRLDKVADRLSETVNKMISYCTILTILMFATFVIAIIFWYKQLNPQRYLKGTSGDYFYL